MTKAPLPLPMVDKLENGSGPTPYGPAVILGDRLYVRGIADIRDLHPYTISQVESTSMTGYRPELQPGYEREDPHK